MLTQIGQAAYNWATSSVPWTNVYGLSRTLLALGTAGTLAATRTTVLLMPTSSSTFSQCSGWAKFAAFCLVPPAGLEFARWSLVAILLFIATGWKPQLTGIIHWWIAWSIQATVLMIDGGDQVTAVVALLLIPVTITDPRAWHWQPPRDPRTSPASSLVALSAITAIRVQVAAIYCHAAIAKLSIPEWADGTALYYWFFHPLFGAPLWLRPILATVMPNAILVIILTWGTLALELGLFTALVMPKRAWQPMLIAGIVFHILIAVVIGLVSFGTAMCAALILYLRPTEQPFAFPVARRLRLLFLQSAHSAAYKDIHRERVMEQRQVVG